MIFSCFHFSVFLFHFLQFLAFRVIYLLYDVLQSLNYDFFLYLAPVLLLNSVNIKMTRLHVKT